MQAFWDQAERAERAVNQSPLQHLARMNARSRAARAQEAAQPQEQPFVYVTREPTWADQVTDFESEQLDAGAQRWAQSQGFHTSIEKILIGIAAERRSARFQANNNGDSEHGSATEAAPSMAGRPGLKPPTDDEEDEKQSDKDPKGIIKRYSDNAAKDDHVFSARHRANGIMRLSTLADDAEKMKDIINRFKAIVDAVDAQGLLKEGTNSIKTVINGLNVQIQVHISNKEVISLNGYINHSARIWPNTINWPQ